MVEVAHQPFIVHTVDVDQEGLLVRTPGNVVCHECCCQRFLDLQLDAYAEIEQVKLHERWQDSEIDKLKRQFSFEFAAIKQRLAAVESAPWGELRTRIETTEGDLQDSVDEVADKQRQINDLDLRVEILEKKDMGSLESELEIAVRKINARGQVRFDVMTGNMQVLRDIAFVPVKAAEKPIATLRDPTAAAAVLDDIGEVAALFENTSITIEGHTGGGTNEFWQQLANDRSDLVAREIVNRGHRGELTKSVGKPGKTGINKSEVKVVLHISHETLQEMRGHILNR